MGILRAQLFKYLVLLYINFGEEILLAVVNGINSISPVKASLRFAYTEDRVLYIRGLRETWPRLPNVSDPACTIARLLVSRES